MSFEIIAVPRFAKDAKRLSKKYPSLKAELNQLFQSLEINPQQGKPLGNFCFKIRLAIRSKNSGKSGGARIITYVAVRHSIVYLLSIYDKSAQEDISDKELQEILKEIEP
jgi:mRNA-degrading endonuclease RelE of RelBE toxin-antitoxin system